MLNGSNGCLGNRLSFWTPSGLKWVKWLGALAWAQTSQMRPLQPSSVVTVKAPLLRDAAHSDIYLSHRARIGREEWLCAILRVKRGLK